MNVHVPLAFPTIIPAPTTIIPPYSDNWPPDYNQVLAWREEAFRLITKGKNKDKVKERIAIVRQYYRYRVPDFISHWCDTFDPRRGEELELEDLPELEEGQEYVPEVGSNSGTFLAYPPFVLFQRQKEFVDFLMYCINRQQGGLVEKSRDMGATWGACGVSVNMFCFRKAPAIGWGSRKEPLVDQIGVLDSIFEKMRAMIRRMPYFFYPEGFDPDEHMPFMRIFNPESGANITGEVGDNIGRGGRKLVYFKDESAHYEHPEAVEASLSENTRCQIDLSSVHGLGTVFHRRREAGTDWYPGLNIPRSRTAVFVFDWSDHPEKTPEWHAAKKQKFEDEGLLHIFNQEVERDYAGAVQGIIIKPEWVKAAIDAHKKLGFGDDGTWFGGMDVADEGIDTNALVKRKGRVIKSAKDWGSRDPGVSCRNAINECRDVIGNPIPISLYYDCIGVGVGVKGEYNRLSEEGLVRPDIKLYPWSAAAAVLDPERRVIPGDSKSPTNEDHFQNLKAQAWHQTGLAFYRTWRAVNDPKFTWTADQLISIDSETIPRALVLKLEKELCQATMVLSTKGKQMVDKTPDGAKSPNIGDACVICCWPTKGHGLKIPPAILAQAVNMNKNLHSRMQSLRRRRF